MTEDRVTLNLTLDETRLLILAVEIALKLDTAALAFPDIQQMATEQIRETQGEAGVARADQALTAARERVPLLQALHGKLTEHASPPSPAASGQRHGHRHRGPHIRGLRPPRP